LPSSALPLSYYLVAHAGLGTALLALVIDPSLPGGSFYHPRFVALVHLLTLAWLTGSILGSLYIVGPLALRVPMPVTKGDWIAFGSFVFGASGMVSHFWINTYDGMAWSAVFVVGAIAWVGSRVIRGLHSARIPWGVGLHVRLAFFNILAGAALGMLLGFDRSRGFLTISPLATMFAHAHIAAIGWVMMLVIGLSYRLIPMILPAAMPSGRSVALSAVLVESGLAVLSALLMADSQYLWIGALLIVRWGDVFRRARPLDDCAPTAAPASAAGSRLVDLAGALRICVAGRRCRSWIGPDPSHARRLPPPADVDVWRRRSGGLPGADGGRDARAPGADVRVVSRLRRGWGTSLCGGACAAVRGIRAIDIRVLGCGCADADLWFGRH